MLKWCLTHTLLPTLSLPSCSWRVTEACVSTPLPSPLLPGLHYGTTITLRAPTSFLSHSPSCPSPHLHPPLMEQMNGPPCLIHHSRWPPLKLSSSPSSGSQDMVLSTLLPSLTHRGGPHRPPSSHSALPSQEPPILVTEALRSAPCTHSPSPSTPSCLSSYPLPPSPHFFTIPSIVPHRPLTRLPSFRSLSSS